MAATTGSRRLFHPGELDVQRRAGVSADAARLEGMLAAAHLDGGAASFLAQRQFAAVTARDAEGRLWTSPLLGPAGFLRAHGSILEVHATFPAADPLAAMPAGQQVGLIAIEFAIRRRFRVNGTGSGVSGHGLTIEADQGFGNCPSYIQRRTLTRLEDSSPVVQGQADVAGGPRGGSALTDQARSLIRSADTFFLGTLDPGRGVDTSHKGGLPGFVRVEDDELWWPDYAGNNMFNSLGNITVNPEASMLFIDFATGGTLHLSGTAELQWIAPGSAGDDGATGRRIRFRPSAVVTGPGLRIRSDSVDPSTDNPRLKD
ncbi:pyridoxamine 5'-phosphate oxidase family protein [Kitasatospora sp. NPDC052896]|uniref:pyridoxamine 5'-phosphate oxidase family protein n=1 Tax=Kitasatospora sp. NPDC052896 TaxID=3364061 RepID=UPI0037C6894B